MNIYNITTDIAVAKVNLDTLELDINSSNIGASLSSIGLEGTTLTILFATVLDVSQKTILDSIVNVHSGEVTVAVEDPTPKTQSSAFGSKTVVFNGEEKSLFQRISGVVSEVTADSDTIIDFVIPYDFCKVNGIEIVGCGQFDRLDFIVCDNALNSVSGLGIGSYPPNFPLNQFGFDVVVDSGAYKYSSVYDADLVKGMLIRVVYKERNSSTKNIGINYIIHEVK